MKLLNILLAFLVIFQVLLGISGCEYHRKLQEAKRKQEQEARLKKIQDN